MQQQPKVSVIVPAKNVERFLDGCLSSVRSCDYPQDRVEIIVVDNGSTDSTVEIAHRYSKKVLSLPEVTISTLRNRGAEQAEGEVLAFIDADCLAGSTWLAAGVENVINENCVAGCIYSLPPDPVWLEADWFCQRDPGRTETTSTAAGNLFIRKKLFDDLTGFNEALVTGEDTEFCARARKVARMISDDRIDAIHLGNPKTIKQFVKREIWYGLGAFGSFRVSMLDKPLFGTLAFAALTGAQILSAALWALGWTENAAHCAQSAFWMSSAAVLALLASTLWVRRRYVKDAGHALRLGFLYYLYYLGRTISLAYIAGGWNYYHNIKK